MKTPGLSTAFCYGTLMAPEVMQVLLGRVPSYQAAVLLGSFRRHPVRTFMFPGLIRAEGDLSNTVQQRIQGVLYQDLSADELKRLDYFEGPEYNKIPCDVETVETNEKVATQLYLWTNPSRDLDLTQTWSYEYFYSNDLDQYLEKVVRPCRDELDKLDEIDNM